MRPSTLVIFAAAAVLAPAACAGLDLSGLDRSVSPADDFFRFVNGNWLKRVVIPPDLARYAGFNQLQDTNWNRLHAICERVAANPAAAPGPEKAVGDFYASGLDMAAIEAAGLRPLQPEFDRIAAIRTPSDVMRALGHLRMYGLRAGFRFLSAPDAKDSNRQLAELDQAGLGLAATELERDADRDYYFRTDEKSRRLREQYVAHLARNFELLGAAPSAAGAAAERVMQLETALAGGSMTRVQLRDPQATYHKIKYDELAAAARGIDWPAYFAATSAPPLTELNLAQPEFFRTFAAQLQAAPIADWRDYLRWHLIRRTSPYLGRAFAAEHYRFFEAALTGVTAPRPRWKEVVAEADDNLGDALGQLYVAEYFPPAAKARALAMVGHLRAALRERLQTLEWMDAPTRAQAVAKLDAFSVKIGYPDHWKDYRSAGIDRSSYVMNVLRAQEFEMRRNLAQIGRPTDKTEWRMTPPTVNAYYSPQVNGITFPAGILQPPFFDAAADDAANYGGIGVVIGHEMTHGFDDTGRQFDAQGNLHDWWTPESAARFKARAAGIVKQFSGYTAIDDVHLNGELTQGENIADLGGLRIAYAALATARAGQPRPLIDGFTPEQRFFISHAVTWRDIMRPEERRRRAAVDPHSPGEWRVNGPLSNLDEFARAFDVPAGAPMRRPASERVLIW